MQGQSTYIFFKNENLNTCRFVSFAWAAHANAQLIFWIVWGDILVFVPAENSAEATLSLYLACTQCLVLIGTTSIWVCYCICTLQWLQARISNRGRRVLATLFNIRQSTVTPPTALTFIINLYLKGQCVCSVKESLYLSFLYRVAKLLPAYVGCG